MEIEINSSQGMYKIYLERGILTSIDRYVDINRKVMVITDSGVPKKYLDILLKQLKNAFYLVVGEGEGSKSLQTYEYCLKELLRNGFSRKDVVIALGGGVVGDLSGFVASSYMRGIDFINIPTTTLSQIDSSIGGKVAINMDNIKNCVGAFYQPKLVLIDFEVLDTLNSRHYNAGLVEAIKAGLIKDEKLFVLFEENKLDIEKIIYKSLLVKKYFVEIDEKEHNERKILNFGHTIGHAYESYYNLKKLLHGECVALGMMSVIQNKEIKERLKNILIKLNLPYEDIVDKEELMKYIVKDKKTFDNKISLIKLSKIGEAIIEDVNIDEVRSII